MLILLFVLFSVVTMFSNFQATFPIILLKYLEYSNQISPQMSEKYDCTFDTKIRVGLEKIGRMMLWIMSGT